MYAYSLSFGNADLLGTIGRAAPGNPLLQEYILPDLSRNQKGRIRGSDDIRLDTDQVLVMNNERFVVPEIIFRPDGIGKV